MKKLIAAVLGLAMILPLLGTAPWTLNSVAEEMAGPVTYEDSFNYDGFDAVIYDSSNLWQTEYLDTKSTEAYGYYDAKQPKVTSGVLHFNEGEGVRLNWTKLQEFATFSADKTYTLTFDVTVTDFGDDATISTSDKSDKTWNREVFFGPAGYYNQIEMRSGRTANDTGSSPKPLGIRAGNVDGGSTEAWADVSLYTENTVYSCTVQWTPAEKKIATTVKNGDTVIIQGYRTNDNYASVNKYMNSFVWRCEDGAFELDNVVLTDGTSTYVQNFESSNAMSSSGLWGLEDVVKTDAVAPVLENGVMKMTDKSSVRFNWTKVSGVGGFDPAKVYTFEFDFNITDSGDGSLWNTKNYTRALYVAFGGYYTVLEMNSTDGLVKCPDNASDTYTEAKYAKQPLHCKIVWEGSVFSVAVSNGAGETLFTGTRTNSDFTDMVVQSGAMTNLVLRCEDGAVEIDNFKFTAVNSQVLQTTDLAIADGTQAVYKNVINYNGSDKVSVKLGANELFSVGPAGLKMGGKGVAGAYGTGAYQLAAWINPDQEMVSLEVILPDGGVVRRGFYTLLGGDRISVYSTNESAAAGATLTYGAISLTDYELPTEEPQYTGFNANVYNLVSSFSDAATTRAFAWTAKTSFLGEDAMALRYRPSGATQWTVVDAVKEAEPVDTADEDYFKCDLSGLTANTAYEYQIGKKDSTAEGDWSKIYSFKTASGSEDSFTFLAVGDTQGITWDGTEKSVKGFMFAKTALDLAFSEVSDPAFLFHAGDVVETGSDKAMWNMYFKALGEHGASTPHFATLGNHDAWIYGNPFYFDLHFNHPDNGGTAALDPAQINKITNSNLLNVAGQSDETVYSYDYGNAHFIVLNTGAYCADDQYLLEAQRQWLIDDLEANKDAEWTIMLFHEPVYHRLGGSESRPWLYDVIEGYGVDLVLQGHSHLVTRTYPMKNGEIVTKTLTDTIPKGTGTIYATLGSTALNHDGTSDTAHVEEMFSITTPQLTQPTYTAVSVENDQLVVTVKQANGLVVDQFTIVNDDSDLGSSDQDLSVNFTEVTTAGTVYSLDMIWENSDLSFDYVAGTQGAWNPADHTYAETSDAGWEDDDLKVTVVNHSNAAVKVSMAITDGNAEDGLTVTSDKNTETLATAEGTTRDNAPKVEYTLTIDGVPTESVTKVATATITFAKAETDLAVKYDDRYTFPHAVKSVETVSVTSRKTGTDTPDEAVIRTDSLRPEVGIACGVGTAKVTLKNGEVYNVTVTAAPISVFLMIGQSNTEGSTTGEASVYTKARNQSIVCEEGQIYSTYGWSTTSHATAVAGITSSATLRVNSAKDFVAESLTSETSRGGGKLEYPLNSLSEGKLGKVGFDSGLAWNWNALTGEKVWIVNCGAGSTTIEVWQPDYDDTGKTSSTEVNHYKICVEVMENVRATMDTEVAAGHYELKNFAYFWLQGESNKNTSKADYLNMFENLHAGLKQDVKMTGDKALEGGGIVMVRAFTQNPATDTQDNGPRLAQKEAVAATTGVFADVFMACENNDLWTSDAKVTEYWNGQYPDSEYPFSVHSQPYVNPVNVSTVHTGVHYLQPGYNEIGIVSAQGAYAALR